MKKENEEEKSVWRIFKSNVKDHDLNFFAVHFSVREVYKLIWAIT